MSKISQIYTTKLNPKFTLLKKNWNFVKKNFRKRGFSVNLTNFANVGCIQFDLENENFTVGWKQMGKN
jgi:hypothetical protein